jgi:hypothetical protein
MLVVLYVNSMFCTMLKGVVPVVLNCVLHTVFVYSVLC